MNSPTWIWKFGDFETHLHLLTAVRRLDRNCIRPEPWAVRDCWHTVFFRRTFHLEKPEKFRVTIEGIGGVTINYVYHPAGEWLEAPAGDVSITVETANLTGLPAIFVEGETIVSDDTWEAAHNNFDYRPVGFWNFNARESGPSTYRLALRPLPLTPVDCAQGLLFDAGQETFAALRLELSGSGTVRILYGESLEEALSDTPCSWIAETAAPVLEEPARGFRYVRILPDDGVTLQRIEARYEYLPLERKGSFTCSDETINRIWDVSCYTLELNSREFFLDGIKRDRYVWSGDAYQSYLLNDYLFFDNDICKRTAIALRGNGPMDRHINTIMDYSFYWVLGFADYLRYTGDLAFVRQIYPEMESLMEFCISRADENGLACQRPGDWIFVDWANQLDKDGPICAEQILFTAALEVFADIRDRLGYDAAPFRDRAADLRAKILRLYWDEDQGAFIDSFTSGNRRVTRHTNLFAIRFGIADARQAALIRKNVLENDAVAPITTPYFKFYELESDCAGGRLETVTEKMLEYWGGMLREGATTFWEEYDPTLPGAEQLHMYGTPFGKSLCHAWGASPIYLLGRFYLGVNPTGDGYSTFTVEPNLGGLDWFRGQVPTPGGLIRVSAEKDRVEVLSDIPGGTLKFAGKTLPILPNTPTVLTR